MKKRKQYRWLYLILLKHAELEGIDTPPFGGLYKSDQSLLLSINELLKAFNLISLTEEELKMNLE